MKTTRQFQLFAIQCMAQAERPISIVVPTAACGGPQAFALSAGCADQVLSDKDTVKRLGDQGAGVETFTPENWVRW